MILVTGGTGLVGCHLLYSLVKENKKVRALHRKNSKTESVRKVFSYYSKDYKKLFDKIEWVEGDINDITSLDVALKDINEILNVLEDFETSDIETLDINKFSQKIDKISEKIDKKYDGKNLDIKK